MLLSPRQLRALESICETFFPATEGWPSAVQLGVPAALAANLDFNPRTSEKAQLLQLLDVWDSRFHSLFANGNFSCFSTLPPDERTRILLDWADSSLAKRRGAFQALRKGVGFLYVMLSDAAGDSAVWRKMKYPGPLAAPIVAARRTPTALAQPLAVTVPERDLKLSCEVCVVGSGAGGGTAAGVLAAAGKDVVVLEAGGYYDDSDFDGSEMCGFHRLYSEAGFAATANHSVGLLAGECVGGGTVVNYCTSFRTPEEIRAEWSAAGVPWFAQDEYTKSLNVICNRLSINTDHNRVSAREKVFERGLHALNWHCAAMPRNVIGCEQGKVCGYCGYGCALGAKQSTAKTWLADAQKGGARIIAETRAKRICIEGGAASGVEARSKDGHFVQISCKTVIVACGAIHSPALLLRSGLVNENIGKHLRLHPVSNVCGVFDEEIRPWEGTLQAIYSDEQVSMTGNYGVKYETTSLQPVIAAAVIPWRDPRQYRALLEKLAYTSAIGVLVRDRDGGRVTIDGEGNPVAHYALSEFDRGHLRRGFLGAAQILEAAGARLIYSPHAKFCCYEPGSKGTLATFTEQMDRAGWASGRVALFSFHIMGTARLGSSSKTSVTNPDGETWEARNLYVMDGASFPSASGVNPMISIEAIAHRNANVLAAKV